MATHAALAGDAAGRGKGWPAPTPPGSGQSSALTMSSTTFFASPKTLMVLFMQKSSWSRPA